MRRSQALKEVSRCRQCLVRESLTEASAPRLALVRLRERLMVLLGLPSALVEVRPERAQTTSPPLPDLPLPRSCLLSWRSHLQSWSRF